MARQGSKHTAGAPERKRPILWLAVAVVVAAVTFIAFLPALDADWLDWDDDVNFLDNPNFRGLSSSHLAWMFTTFHMGPYQPLSWVTLGVDYLAWDMRPFGYHLTNVLLHSANAVLFLFVCARLLATTSRRTVTSAWLLPLCAAFGALVFGIHPLRVESVAWITERRDVLNGFFVLWTVLLYVTACERERSDSERRRLRAGAWICYACSLLAKASSVTLPVALLVLDVYPLRRLHWQPPDERRRDVRTILIEKIPFLALAALAGAVALFGQKEHANLLDLSAFGPARRLAVASYAGVHYVWKTVWPGQLVPLYGLDATLDPLRATYVLRAGAMAAATVLLIVWRRRMAPVLAAWLVYLVILSPVSGLAQAGPQIAADRYTYLACMPFAVLASAALFTLARPRPGGRVRLRLLATGVIVCSVVVALGARTWQQCRIWKDSVTLWTHAVQHDPDLLEAQLHLGDSLFAAGDLAGAIAHYRRGAEIRPSHAEAHSNLGNALCIQGDFDAGMTALRKAIELDPALAEAHNNLGSALCIRGDLDGAVTALGRAIELAPDSAEAHYNLGRALFARGDPDGALRQYERAVGLRPTRAKPYAGIGEVLCARGRLDAGIAALRKAISIEPRYARAHDLLGNALRARGDLDAGVAALRKAVALDPRNANAHYQLGNTYFTLGRLDQAAVSYRRALSVDQDHLNAWFNLGNACAAGGDFKTAAQAYEQVLRLNPDDAEAQERREFCRKRIAGS